MHDVFPLRRVDRRDGNDDHDRFLYSFHLPKPDNEKAKASTNFIQAG